MLLLLLQVNIDWAGIGKNWGPTGVFSIVFLILIVGGAKLAKSMLTDTIADARKERDLLRQTIKEQATEFTAHIKEENDEFRRSLKEVVDSFERAGRKR